MKKNLKKTLIAVITALTMLFAVSYIPALADETGAADEAVPTQIAAAPQAPAAPQTETQPAKSGMGTGGVVTLFILALLINAALSFAISNRFYKMSRKDSHLQAEIRALRRDIDEKFTGNIKEVKEKSAAVKNSNRNYSRDGGITYKDEATPMELSEIAKKWNIEIEREDEPNVKIKQSRRVSRGKRATDYKPEREEVAAKSVDNGNIDADADVSESVKDKAKKFLGDIFPFDEE